MSDKIGTIHVEKTGTPTVVLPLGFTGVLVTPDGAKHTFENGACVAWQFPEPVYPIRLTNIDDPKFTMPTGMSAWDVLAAQGIPPHIYSTATQPACTCPAADMLAEGWTCTCGAKP